MKAQFVSRVFAQTWNYDQLRARPFLAHMALTLLRNERPAEDVCGDPLPVMRLEGDVAVIPLSGVLMINLPDWIKPYGFGLTDVNDIEEEVKRATADANVAFTVYDCDSPGGMSLAGDKLYSVTEKAREKKPIFYYCGDGCDVASTAFEGVASCQDGLAAPFASGIGCIGTYLPWLDDTEFWAKLGIKFEVFRSGELKGLGIDGLSPAQRAYLQGMVDEAGATFRKNVLKYRSGIARADMEGQWFEGVKASEKGFVAGNAPDLEAAIAKFRRMAKAGV
jgi:ClpP class serine protease